MPSGGQNLHGLRPTSPQEKGMEGKPAVKTRPALHGQVKKEYLLLEVPLLVVRPPVTLYQPFQPCWL